MNDEIAEAARRLTDLLAALPEDERIEAVNAVRLEIHRVSPMRAEPVDCVLWVQATGVAANEYNPNVVAPPEMELLRHSIEADGYTQPIVTFHREDGQHEVVDGFHRNRIGRECEPVRQRVRDRLPVVAINLDRADMKDRIAATIRHNRARGVHSIEPMAQIVARLYFNGWSNKRIAQELGMEKDEVLRLKQFTGLGSLFEHRTYSKAWTVVEEAIEGDGDGAGADD